jgi:hypothetical protein
VCIHLIKYLFIRIYIYTMFLINISSSSGRRHRWAVQPPQIVDPLEMGYSDGRITMGPYCREAYMWGRPFSVRVNHPGGRSHCPTGPRPAPRGPTDSRHVLCSALPSHSDRHPIGQRSTYSLQRKVLVPQARRVQSL